MMAPRKILKSVGDKIEPCFKPVRSSNCDPCSHPSVLTVAIAPLCNDAIRLTSFGGVPQNINILSSPESNNGDENQNIITIEKEENVIITKKKKVLSEESKIKISESKRNKNKKYGIVSNSLDV
jgi:hypothetical protein